MEGMEMNESFWFGKKVLITGHTGFKGSWLSIWLNYLGAIVLGYSLKQEVSIPSLHKLSLINSKIIGISGDISDLKYLKEILNDFKPEIIIHMAAQSLVKRSYIEPINTFLTNVMGTANLLEASRYCSSIKVILNITSDKCYENKNWEWGYREIDPLGGDDPYSSSKACAELITSSFYRSFFQNKSIGLASARAGNVIGGGDWAQDRLIPDAIRAFSSGATLMIRNPKATRPWQHVLDPLAGYMILIENLWKESSQFSKSWNFGPDNAEIKNVEWIAQKMIEYWGNNSKWERTNLINNFHEANQLKLDISNSVRNLNWYPKWGIDKSLEKTLEWYKNYINGKNVYEITINQIIEYTKKM